MGEPIPAPRPSLQPQSYALSSHHLQSGEHFQLYLKGFFPMHWDRKITVLAGLATCLAITACSNSTQVIVPNVSQQAAPQGAPRPAQNQPAPNPPIVKGAESGKKQILTSISAVDPDCASQGYAAVTVVKAPQNGQVTSEKGEAFPTFAKDNVRSVCDTKKLPATMLYYTSNPGFTGMDSSVVEVLFPDGVIRRLNFAISVR
jgi:hypothetical protein